MTDNLRDRIEDVLWENFDEAAPSLSMRDMADAVIRDVLTPEFLADLVIQSIQQAADDTPTS